MGIISGALTADAVLSGATGLLGSIFGAKGASDANKMNLQIARETNQQNYQMFREGQNWQKYMWNLENQYNLPVNQKQRLLAAGINPAALVDSPQLGAASSPGSAPAPNAAQGYTYQSPYTAMANQTAQFANNMLAISQTQKNLSEAKGQEIDNLYKEDSAKANIRYMVSAGLLNEQQARNLEQQYDLTEINWDSLMKRAQQEAYFTAEQARQLKLANDLMETYGDAIKKEELRKITQEIALLLEKGETEKAHQKLMEIQGNEEHARTIIMRDEQRQNAKESNSRILVNNLQAVHQSIENDIYKEFGRAKYAQDFLEASKRTENLLKEGKILHMKGLLLELEKDLRTLPANQRAAATGIWMRNMLPFLGWASTTYTGVDSNLLK